MPISFCAGISHHITDDGVKEEILRDVSDRLKVRTMMREAKVFRPGAGQDTSGCYVAHLQSSGNPYVLFLTRLGFTESSMYIDRKVRPGHALPRIIVDHVRFPRDLYDGTAISGEMVRTAHGEWRFLAEDLLAVRGKPLGRVPYRDRYAALLQVVGGCGQLESDTHGISVKRAFPADDAGLQELRAHAADVPYGTSGVVYRSLVPGRSNWFVRGAAATTPAAKKADTRLVTVRSTVTPDVYQAVDGDGRDAGILCVQGMDMSRELAAALGGGAAGSEARWLCRWSDAFAKWVPLPGGAHSARRPTPPAGT